MASDQLQQGIAAFQAGDRARAKDILEAVVAAEPNNDAAWYYLAAAQTNPNTRVEYLRRVLQINPDHVRAKEVLARMEAAMAEPLPPLASEGGTQGISEGGFTSNRRGSQTPRPRVVPKPNAGGGGGAEHPLDSPSASRRAPSVRPLRSNTGTPGEAESGGFVLPISIPDAPTRVDFSNLLQDGLDLLRAGVAVLQRKPGAYSTEVNQATWWRFWVLVLISSALIAVFSTLEAIFDRRSGTAIALTLLLGIPMEIILFYAGSWLSHWWANRQGMNAPLYQHSYTLAIPYMTMQVITSALSAVFSLFGLGALGSLINFFLSIYAIYVASFGFDMLYVFRDPNQKWITLLMFFVGVIAAGLLIGILLGPIGIATIGFLST